MLYKKGGCNLPKTSKAQLKAKDKYQKANPDKTYYWKRKSEARGFIVPSSSTRLYKLIESDPDLKANYIDDLISLQAEIKKRIATIKG